MSEQTEKLVHIIMPDLLNYLEMRETREIYENRLKKIFRLHKEKKIANLLLIKQKKTKTKNKFCIFVKK